MLGISSLVCFTVEKKVLKLLIFTVFAYFFLFASAV